MFRRHQPTKNIFGADQQVGEALQHRLAELREYELVTSIARPFGVNVGCEVVEHLHFRLPTCSSIPEGPDLDRPGTPWLADTLSSFSARVKGIACPVGSSQTLPAVAMPPDFIICTVTIRRTANLITKWQRRMQAVDGNGV